MPPSSCIADKILSAPVGAVAACIMLAIVMGCMSLSIGNRTIETQTSEEGVLCQQGKAVVPANDHFFVRYPIPYLRKPNVEISCTFDDCLIQSEEEDGFAIKNPNCNARTVTWKARGIKPSPPPEPPNPVQPPPPDPASPPSGSETPTLPTPTPERKS